MSKNERVMDYLLDRIEQLEKEKRDEWFQKQGLSKGNEILHQEIDNLKEKIEQYEIEREHIKEIITCNIAESPHCAGRYCFGLVSDENDFKTLLSILDIKLEDYEVQDNDADKISPPPSCWGCKHEELDGNAEPCLSCFNGDHKEVTTDAENKD